jgi:aspartyl/glutamyl-tRNA(Asn/Gln) amidotransferase C subunit
MTTEITREELLALAAMSKIQLSESEIIDLQKKLKDIMAYAARVSECPDQALESNKLINIWRDDVNKDSNSELYLDLAPRREENYFVVPKVLDK